MLILCRMNGDNTAAAMFTLPIFRCLLLYFGSAAACRHAAALLFRHI